MRVRRYQDIRINYFNTTAYEGLSASSTEYSQFHFPRHFHNHYSILFVEDGVNEGFTERNKYKISKGGVLIINPGELHAGNSYLDKYLKFQSLRIEEKFLIKLCEENELNKKGDVYFDNLPIFDSVLSDQMRFLVNSLNVGNCKIETESHFTELLVYLIANYSNQIKSSPPESSIESFTEKARSYIYENYQQDFTLEDIARYVNISPYHLIRQFKKRFGLSPFQYLRNLRIEKAKQMLSGEVSITQIAHDVGFFDHSHFLRNFKKIEGTQPSTFRKNMIN